MRNHRYQRRMAGRLELSTHKIGKIANDDVGETIQAVVDGLTSKEFALAKLIYMRANNQICFSNDKALKYLKFISAETVK